MSRSFLTPISLNGLELQNATIQNLGTAPTGATSGRIYYSTALQAPVSYNGTAWISLDAAQVPANYIPFAKVAGIQSAINATSLSAFAAPTANIPMAGYSFTGLATPTAAGQAATYDFVLGQLQTAQAGLSVKGPVITVYTSNVGTLSGAAAANDGVTPAAGSRVLLTGQTTASQNGVWVTASGAWARPTTDGNAELETGATWLVDQGSTYLRTQWTLSTIGAITPGTTSVTIVQFNAAMAYTAGNGLVLAGSQFAAQVVAAGGVLATASGLSVDTTVVTRKYPATIGDGSSTSYTVTHNLGTLDVVVQAYLVSSGAGVELDVTRTSTSVVTIGFGSAPAANSIRVLVQG